MRWQAGCRCTAIASKWDWLYVKDHCSAIRCVLASGKLGQVYNVVAEKANIAIVHTVCDLLDELGHALTQPYAQISYVRDRTRP
jgi:dTDP-glucose 4,6-dehydratase